MGKLYISIIVPSVCLSVLLQLVIGSSFITVPKGMCYSLTISSLNAKLSRHTFTINLIYLELLWLILLKERYSKQHNHLELETLSLKLTIVK